MAKVRHLHKHALSTSKVEELARRCVGKQFRMDDMSTGRKKKDRWAMLVGSKKEDRPAIFATSSYSRWMHVTWGGTLDSSRCLSHTGRGDGAVAPLAISPTAFKKRTRPVASLMAWLIRTAKMKLPHLRRVTCSSTFRSSKMNHKIKKKKKHLLKG